LEEALANAESVGLDLVEVSATEPPVCKIMDYGNIVTSRAKNSMTPKKSQTIIQVKEIKLKPKTEEHDVQVKLKHIKKFFER